MDGSTVRSFYRKREVVEDYARAAHQVGLWESEELVVRHNFKPEDRLLELGCGAGRIAFGLWEIGYRKLVAIDFSREMVREAKRMAKSFGCEADFRQGDATSLRFEDASFEGVIFGFNGLMQIPKRENRQLAIQEAARVVVPGGRFVFTTHDRENPKNRQYWDIEKKRWNEGVQQHELDEFGDIYRDVGHGQMFIHSPRLCDVQADLEAAGFKVEMQKPRSAIANEPQRVRDFSDDCRFWVARKG